MCVARQRAKVRVEVTITQEVATTPMPHHLTPSELARETGLDRRDVIATCLETGVPIYHGRIDKTLFTATLRERTGASELSAGGVH